MLNDLIITISNALKKNPDLKIDVAEPDQIRHLKLMGEGGLLDSLQLVVLIVDVEQEILKEYGKKVNIVNDAAFSSQNSPFENVEIFAIYLEKLLLNKNE